MNKVYRVVWNVATASWSVVAETAKGRTKGARRVILSNAVVAVALAMSMGAATAGESCKTVDGRVGSLDAEGVCQLETLPSVAMAPTVSAALSDTYFKVNSSGAAVTGPSDDGVVIGPGAKAEYTVETVIGAGASGSNGSYPLALGRNAAAGASMSIAAGYGASTSAWSSVAIGQDASLTNSFATAIGRSAKAAADASVALGYQSVSDRGNAISVGSSDASTGFTRQIVNVGAGTKSNDAVNVSQFKPLVDALGGGASIDPTTGAITGPTYALTNGGTQTTVGGALTGLDTALTQLDNQVSSGTVGIVQKDAATSNLTVGMGLAGSIVDFSGSAGARVLKGIADGVDGSDAITLAQLKAATTGPIKRKAPNNALFYDDETLTSMTLAGSGGTTIKNVASGLVASGSMDAVNGDQLYQTQQTLTSNADDLQSQIDDIIANGGADAYNGGKAKSTTNVAAGTVDGNNGMAMGDGSNVTGDNGTATGVNASVTANNGTAIGQGASVSGVNGTAMGQGASASGANSTAIGSNSSATGNNSVAIGAGSVADRDNTVSVGSAGNERQITNVAAGTAPTDMVNVGQMNDSVRSERRDAMGGIAAAMAVAELPQSSRPGRVFIAAAGSTYGGEVGTAVGASYMSHDGKWTAKIAADTSSRGEVGANFGVAMHW